MTKNWSFNIQYDFLLILYEKKLFYIIINRINLLLYYHEFLA
jgi:hypothetical protein